MSGGLVVVLTRGVTLADWQRVGMLDRELALYRRLVEAGMRVTLVSGGSGPAEAAVAASLAPIEVAYNDQGWPAAIYARLWQRRHRKVLAGCDLIKTNQTDGGDAAAAAAQRFSKPLIARCGYMLSDFRARRYGRDDKRTRSALQLEARLFTAATRVQVTTPAMADDVRNRHLGSAINDRIRVVPNYVETNRFHPPSPPCSPSISPPPPPLPAEAASAALFSHQSPTRLIFIGRHSAQKNLPALLRAVADLPVHVTLVGTGTADGPAATELRPLWQTSKATFDWVGQVPHADLPDLLRQARIFVMPSHYEGHPKALIEAMASGLAVVAADRPGLREVVDHQTTGLLCEPEPTALRHAIGSLLDDPALRQRLGRAARETAVQRYSLERILELELAVLKEAIDEHRAGSEATDG